MKALVATLLLMLTNYAFAEFDSLGRLINYEGKIEVACPIQENETGVILVIGQSNSGNHGQKQFMSRFPTQVYNFYDGRCYMASSPLLGTTGTKGEFMTPLADYLIEFGVYKKVIIVPSGIDGTKIALWKEGGLLNDMLMSVLDKVYPTYHLTEIVWHQGESDFLANTPAEDYKESFNSLLSSLRNRQHKIPFYYAIATHCSVPWTPYNPIAQVQRTLVDAKNNVYLGADTDTLVPDNERIDYNCHFSEIGQLKTALSYALSISQNHIAYLRVKEDKVTMS